jgi:AraC family transcriptional regulator
MAEVRFVKGETCKSRTLRTGATENVSNWSGFAKKVASQFSARENRGGAVNRVSDMSSTRLARDRMSDPIVTKLEECLLASVERSDRASQLFVEHIQLALNAHLSYAYGVNAAKKTLGRGGLAPWQERRARELMDARLGSEVRLAEIAAECELSPKHFARAFKQSTGKSPYRWLLERRIERSQVILSTSGLPIAEIALMCGFADQSHFTRVFARTTGMSPRAWQRASRMSNRSILVSRQSGYDDELGS